MTTTEISKWLPFCDNEITSFQYHFETYLMKNEHLFDVHSGYKFAILASGCQYQMRVLKHRINGDYISDSNIKLNDTWLNMVAEYDGLIDYVINEATIIYESLDNNQKVDYLVNINKYSYFNIDDKTKQNIINDIHKIKIKNEK
jgi:hypothetical protein